MGRGRLPMEPIQNDSTRKTTFQKRKKGLMKKAYEFSTLCAVDVCLIIYGLDSADQPDTWPEDPQEISRILEKYKSKNTKKLPKHHDLHEFFNVRRNKVEAEIEKVRKEIIKVLYPTWDVSFNCLGQEQLRDFIGMLDTKLEACNQRIKMLKRGNLLMQKEVGYEVEATDRRLRNFLQNKSQVPYCYAPMNQFSGNINNQLPLCTIPFDKADFDPILAQFMEKNNGTGKIDQVGVSMLGRDIVTSTAINGVLDYYPKPHVPEQDEEENNRNLPVSYYNGSLQSMHTPYSQYPPWQSLPVQNCEAALQIFPIPTHGFQANGYYDQLQAKKFEFLNAK